MIKTSHFVLGLFAVVGVWTWITSGSREPNLHIELSDDDAFTMASTILARGKVTGCGDLRIMSQIPGSSIRVECRQGDAVKQHRVSYYPDLEVDYRPVADRSTFKGIMDEDRLSRIFCVQNPDGTWERAYLRERDAVKRAEEISTELSKGATVFYGFDGSWIKISEDSDGSWSGDNGDFKHDPQGHGPDGCRI